MPNNSEKSAPGFHNMETIDEALQKEETLHFQRSSQEQKQLNTELLFTNH